MMRAQHRQRDELNGIIAMIGLLVVLLPLVKILIGARRKIPGGGRGDEEGR
jgi:hypothetical protein